MISKLNSRNWREERNTYYPEKFQGEIFPTGGEIAA